MGKSSRSNNGCLLWLILGALLFIGLTLAGFSTTAAAKWAVGLVLGGACGVPLFIMAIFAGVIGFLLLLALLLIVIDPK